MNIKNRTLPPDTNSRLNVIVAGFFFAFALSLATVPLLAGCGRSEKRIKVVPVSGKVSFYGQPPVGALIVLHPTSALEAADVAPSGTIKEDGSYQISVYGAADGAPPGEYVATIEWFRIVTGANGEGGGRGPNVLPPKYAQKDLSPIKVTVNASATEVPPITITR